MGLLETYLDEWHEWWASLGFESPISRLQGKCFTNWANRADGTVMDVFDVDEVWIKISKWVEMDISLTSHINLLCTIEIYSDEWQTSIGFEFPISRLQGECFTNWANRFGGTVMEVFDVDEVWVKISKWVEMDISLTSHINHFRSYRDILR